MHLSYKLLLLGIYLYSLKLLQATYVSIYITTKGGTKPYLPEAP